MDDLISRQAAIDALNEYFAIIGKLKRRGLTKGEKAISIDTVGTIKTLPSAQPEIIYCGNCKNYYFASNRIPEEREWYCARYGTQRAKDDFCSRAERREEGEIQCG